MLPPVPSGFVSSVPSPRSVTDGSARNRDLSPGSGDIAGNQEPDDVARSGKRWPSLQGRMALYRSPSYRTAMGETDRAERSEETNVHLQDVEDGCGCAEVWEHLSAERDARRED